MNSASWGPEDQELLAEQLGMRDDLALQVVLAERANLDARPEPAPAQPGDAAWKAIGTRADPAPQGGTAG